MCILYPPHGQVYESNVEKIMCFSCPAYKLNLTLFFPTYMAYTFYLHLLLATE